MINFETSEMIDQVRTLLHGMVKNIVRPIARYYDDHEHERPKELEPFKPIMQAGMGGGKRSKKEKKEIKQTEDRVGSNAIGVVGAEELSWGDVGLMLAMPGGGLGNAAINAVATDEQYERFGMKYCAMERNPSDRHCHDCINSPFPIPDQSGSLPAGCHRRNRASSSLAH